MKITVLSDGGWGTALAQHLCGIGREVTLWGPFPDYLETMKKTRENVKFLPGPRLHPALKLESDMAAAVNGAAILVLASPSQYMRSTLEKLWPFFRPEQHLLVNVAKGIEVETLQRMSQVCVDVLGSCRYVVLSGPSHAEEVVYQAPTAVVAAAADPALAEIVQNHFMADRFRIYTCSDVIGVELGGALKNVMAIAAGVIDGMKLGDNAKAAMMTRGIAEMGRLGRALGGNDRTFSGLSGIGDLIVTCTSGHSRNRHVGEELGRGRAVADIIRDMGMVVAEGVKTAASAHQLAVDHGVETPIISQIYEVLYHDKDPRQALEELMNRKARSEFDLD
ncbi:MAG: NAD(P)-dependent glycerol-3-phosphate dehydrogenase [Victivallales bacterium]|nr:NAD(P)-dependent glycerol-3-phosphate dehydrogenase [Victivallales bacterium]